jgi:hypothetical protein
MYAAACLSVIGKLRAPLRYCVRVLCVYVHEAASASPCVCSVVFGDRELRALVRVCVCVCVCVW